MQKGTGKPEEKGSPRVAWNSGWVGGRQAALEEPCVLLQLISKSNEGAWLPFPASNAAQLYTRCTPKQERQCV